MIASCPVRTSGKGYLVNAQFFRVFPHPAGREHTGKNVEHGNTK